MLQEEENEPTPATESQEPTNTQQKGQKRGAPVGGQDNLQEAPNTSTKLPNNNHFDNQYSQRRKRIRREKKQEIESLNAAPKTEPGISNQEERGRDQMASMQTNPSGNGLKWVDGKNRQAKAMHHKAQKL